MRVAVCDDEKEVAVQTASMVKNMGWSAESFTKGKDVLRSEADVYILDIAMADMNGLDVGMQLRKRDARCSIIYVTNLDDYRPQAFRVHAFDYINKPVTFDKLYPVLQDAALLHEDKKEPLFFKTKEGRLQISAEEIMYLEFSQRKVLLHSLHHTYVLLQSLHALEETLRPYGFVMAHKAFLVNLAYVRLVKGTDITMSDHSLLPLSQKRAVQFRKALNEWLYARMMR